MFNLLSNAFKFTPRGGAITLAASIVGEDVQIAVADNGPGMPADVKANGVRALLGQEHAGTRGGAGLGLALVNRFLELHDGWVEIESGPGERHTGTLPPAAPRHDDEPYPQQPATAGQLISRSYPWCWSITTGEVVTDVGHAAVVAGHRDCNGRRPATPTPMMIMVVPLSHLCAW